MPTFESEFTDEESEIIISNFKRLGNNTYLDHAGTTLYSERQLDATINLLKENLFCNPHTCKVTGDYIDQVRFKILKHFNTNANDYAVIFTANATASLKLVAECFDFGDNGCFYFCQENHTSVLGMRNVVKTENIFVLTRNELLENLNTIPDENENLTTEFRGNSLITFSAQDNFSGYKTPLNLITQIQKKYKIKGGKKIRGVIKNQNVDDAENQFFVCLDAASFVATNHLDLDKYKPDFVCISFYKIFGFPTGVGALIVSKRGQNVLQKNYYGGGTVKIAMTLEDFHEKRDEFTSRFEDGTLPFLSIAAILEGFRTIEKLVPAKNQLTSIQRISKHVFQLAKYCYEQLKQLKYKNGSPLIRFYNAHGYNNVEQQGGIVTFNVLNDDNSYVGFAEIACLAALYNIQMRTGCFCNPGACQSFLQLSNSDIRKQFEAGHICSDYNDLVDGIPTGAVRLSFGYMTNRNDIEKVIDMFRTCFLQNINSKIISNLIEKRLKLPKALQDIPKRLCPKLLKICIYPIKSCGSYEIYDKWKLKNHGFEYDRMWLIVDENGRALTQKDHVRLCLIKPKIHLSEGIMEITFPEMDSINVPLNVSNSGKTFKSNICCSKVCNNIVEGIDCGDDVANWLSDCLECPGLRLINHEINEEKCQNKSLANQAQFLLINRKSVSWLKSKIESEMETIEQMMDRFRANLIIETSRPFDENNFDLITIGKTKLQNIGPCTRCQMICIDQQTGKKTIEPLRTISREFNGKIRFGIYLSMLELPKDNTISCNDLIILK